MKLQERDRLHKMTIDELNKELAEAERTLLTYRFDAGLNRLTNPAGMHNTRKRIAALKTIIREKELMAEHGFSSMREYQAYQAGANTARRAARKAR